MKSQLYINEIQPLFDDAQRSRIFNDQKTMTDAVPLFPVSEINKRYEEEKGRDGFDLRSFVLTNFDFIGEKAVRKDDMLSITEHIEKLWDELTHTASENEGTLLKLPKPYIVPGGRFNEFFYWDSYFVMLGLQVSGRVEMIKTLLKIVLT